MKQMSMISEKPPDRRYKSCKSSIACSVLAADVRHCVTCSRPYQPDHGRLFQNWKLDVQNQIKYLNRQLVRELAVKIRSVNKALVHTRAYHGDEVGLRVLGPLTKVLPTRGNGDTTGNRRTTGRGYYQAPASWKTSNRTETRMTSLRLDEMLCVIIGSLSPHIFRSTHIT